MTLSIAVFRRVDAECKAEKPHAVLSRGADMWNWELLAEGAIFSSGGKCSERGEFGIKCFPIVAGSASTAEVGSWTGTSSRSMGGIATLRDVDGMSVTVDTLTLVAAAMMGTIGILMDGVAAVPFTLDCAPGRSRGTCV